MTQVDDHSTLYCTSRELSCKGELRFWWSKDIHEFHIYIYVLIGNSFKHTKPMQVSSLHFEMVFTA